jgi:hypothetical protein
MMSAELSFTSVSVRPVRARWIRHFLLLTGVVVLPVAAGWAAGVDRISGRGAEQSLFDGRTLQGWAQSGFEMEGAVRVVNPFQEGRGAIVIEQGTKLSGVTWTRGALLPRNNYEISLEAMRLAGGDFFCGLTFPVEQAACTLVVGGWGGNVVGLSNIDRVDAAENETSREREFSDRRWYRIRVRVTPEKIEAWIDDDPVVALKRAGRVIGLRPGEIQKSLPLGIATYMTKAAVRDIRLRRL